MAVLAEAADRSCVVFLSSTDEEEEVVALTSEEDAVVEVLGVSGIGSVNGGIKSKKRRRKKRRGSATDGGFVPVEDPISISDSIVTEENDGSDSLILRKLLRGPRYFDQECGTLHSCFICGEEGHAGANCTLEKKKPCFVCGLFGHNAKSCSQCFVCNKKGHFAKDCPDKRTKSNQDCKFCLRCGCSGHDMTSCTGDYESEDLEKIRCYVCNNFGHLCCADLEVSGSGDVSCYNCGLVGHTGLGCAKSRGGATAVGSSPSCYVCGEEGHFARGCTQKKKLHRRGSESSTPKAKRKKEKKSIEFQSATNDIGLSSKKRKRKHEKWSMSPVKPNTRWSSEDFSSKKFKVKDSLVKGQSLISCSKGRKSAEIQSATCDDSRSRKKRSLQHDNWSMSPRRSGATCAWSADDPHDFTSKKFMTRGSQIKKGKHENSSKKFRVRGGWMVDDSGRSSQVAYGDSGWNSPMTPIANTRNPWTFPMESHYLATKYSRLNHTPFSRIPNSFPDGESHYHQHSSGWRYGQSSKYGFWRR